MLLKQKGMKRSKYTIHKYMKELGLRSVVMRRKPQYIKGTQHKVFENHLKRDFTAQRPNQKWCTDFTYLALSNGQKRYNCSILDLYDRSIVASLNSKSIDAQLAINTLKIALEKHKIKDGILLHSDQGSQFTSKESMSTYSVGIIISDHILIMVVYHQQRHVLDNEISTKCYNFA